MKTLCGLVGLLLVTSACTAVETRRGVVDAREGVDIVAVERAVAALKEATRGDTDLGVRPCVADDGYCIMLVAEDDIWIDGEKANGYTNEAQSGDDTVWSYIDRDFGNTPMTIAHELLHAIGIRGHTTGRGEHVEAELLYRAGEINEAKVFGEQTQRMYRDEFGVTPDTLVIEPISLPVEE
jgi:hypothetical protein